MRRWTSSPRSAWQDSVTLGCVGCLCSLCPQPGGVCLLSPSRDVFPQGLPDEYAFVTTFRLRKSSRREDWYIWQVIDQYGIPQVRAACHVPVPASVSSSLAGQHLLCFLHGSLSWALKMESPVYPGPGHLQGLGDPGGPQPHFSLMAKPPAPWWAGGLAAASGTLSPAGEVAASTAVLMHVLC